MFFKKIGIDNGT